MRERTTVITAITTIEIMMALTGALTIAINAQWYNDPFRGRYKKQK
ncbi:hypothetical protein SOASR030_02540 [Leminorella grimontii]|uniref:Uncharacterized protein n=1 Tax=Leminorella grimontii TaxID=82981 RepID=A0AAV5MXG1_9GAMM|nr:hypothetical protein GLGR_1841 [Leminorella grimontii ATCC 33999 = DSM 5078]GKX54142.1 hypothetical protein SOASR030_02540 [Leminorella grimontii]